MSRTIEPNYPSLPHPLVTFHNLSRVVCAQFDDISRTVSPIHPARSHWWSHYVRAKGLNQRKLLMFKV